MSLNHVLSKACWFVNCSVEHTFHQASSNGGQRGWAEESFVAILSLCIKLKPWEEHSKRKGLFIQD